MTLASEFERLSQLHEAGRINDAEYEEAKRQLLSGSSHYDPRGATSESGQLYAKPLTNGLAIASLILGLVGIGIGHVLALFFGYKAKRQIEHSGGAQRGRGLAIAGIVLGWIGVTAIVGLLIAWASLRFYWHNEAMEAVEAVIRTQEEFESDNPNRISLAFAPLIDRGFEANEGLDVMLYGIDGGGYCVEAKHEGIGEQVFYWQGGNYIGVVEGSCRDKIKEEALSHPAEY